MICCFLDRTVEKSQHRVASGPWPRKLKCEIPRLCFGIVMYSTPYICIVMDLMVITTMMIIVGSNRLPMHLLHVRSRRIRSSTFHQNQDKGIGSPLDLLEGRLFADSKVYAPIGVCVWVVQKRKSSQIEYQSSSHRTPIGQFTVSFSSLCNEKRCDAISHLRTRASCPIHPRYRSIAPIIPMRCSLSLSHLAGYLQQQAQAGR